MKPRKILVLNYEFPPLGGGASPVSEEISNRKPFKLGRLPYFSSLRTVMIFPGDRKVAGRFHFFGGLI